MTWFRVDDSLAMHPKVLAAGNRAMGAWILAGCWSSYYLTDGFIPSHVLPVMGATKADAARLVGVGLWDDAEGGYQFHDWDHYQPTAEEVRAERAAKHEAKAKAGRMGGVASGISRRRNGANAKQNGSTAEANGEANDKQNEAPTRPDPIQTPSVSAPPAKHAIPEDWHPTAEDQVWAAAECPSVNVSRETASFVDFFLDKGEKRPGWTRSWKRWMREAQERAEKRAPLRAVPDDRLGSWDV